MISLIQAYYITIRAANHGSQCVLLTLIVNIPRGAEDAGCLLTGKDEIETPREEMNRAGSLSFLPGCILWH